MPKTQSTTLSNGENGTEGEGDQYLIDLVINQFLDTSLEKRCFNHYMEGSGTTLFILPDEWVNVKNYAETEYQKTDTPNNSDLTPSKISFYNSTNDLVLGEATVYFRGSTAAGLKDTYNFNNRPWGERGIKEETLTRLGGYLKIIGAKDFEIRYGEYN